MSVEAVIVKYVLFHFFQISLSPSTKKTRFWSFTVDF
jgi:hypothetical protein